MMNNNNMRHECMSYGSTGPLHIQDMAAMVVDGSVLLCIIFSYLRKEMILVDVHNVEHDAAAVAV